MAYLARSTTMNLYSAYPQYFPAHLLYPTDSWIEVSSQPSSSSVSSAADEIITTGLRVQHDHLNRRRRPRTSGLHQQYGYHQTSIEGSSQEEYEESESESDRVISSSTEGLPTTSLG